MALDINCKRSSLLHSLGYGLILEKFVFFIFIFLFEVHFVYVKFIYFYESI